MGRALALVLAALGLVMVHIPPATDAQQGQPAGSLVIRLLAEKKAVTLPAGRPRLYWRLESFPNLSQAQTAAGPWGLAVEASGSAWLATLGPRNGASAGGTKVAEVGPLPPVAAREYLLRVNEPSGAPGSTTVVHTHPGTEAFYVLEGELCVRTPNGMLRIPAGRSEAGTGPDTPVQVSNCGTTEVRGLVMFVVDAARPFSSPAVFP